MIIVDKMQNITQQLNLSSKDGFLQAFCYAIFTALCLAPLFGGEYFLPLYLIVYLDFLKNSRNHPKDTLSRYCLVGFLISFGAVIFYGVYHYEVLTSGSKSAKYTLIAMGWFAFGFMIIDSARFQFSFYRLRLRILSFILIVTSFSSVIFLVAKKFIEEPNLVYIAHSISIRVNFLGDLNSNHVDNIILYVVLLLIWSVANCSKNNYVILAVALTNFLILIFLYYISGSRGGAVGLLVSALVVGVLFICRNNKKIYLLYLAIALGAVMTAGILTSTRIANGLNTVKILVTNIPSIEEISGSSSHNFDEERIAVLDIMTKPSPEDELSTSEKVAQFCWENGLANEPSSFGKLDRSTVVRYQMYLEGVKIWLKNPYFGQGDYDKKKIISKNENSDPCMVGFFSHTHNHYINILIYHGFIGLIIFSFLIFYLIYIVDKTHCSTNSTYIILFYFIYLLVENNFDLTFDRNSDLLSVLFCVLLLFSVSLSKERLPQDKIDEDA